MVQLLKRLLKRISAKACQYFSTSSRLTELVKVWPIQHLKTANSGYLTRRLSGRCARSVVSEEDCGTENGLVMTPVILKVVILSNHCANVY